MKDLKKKVSAVYTAEQKLANKTKALILDIVNCIEDTELEGVTPIKSNVRCATVSFKTISENYKTNLTPSFYISACQTEILREKISSLQTLSEVVHFVNKAIEDGCVVIKGEKILFNPAVKEKLITIQNMF